MSCKEFPSRHLKMQKTPKNPVKDPIDKLENIDCRINCIDTTYLRYGLTALAENLGGHHHRPQRLHYCFHRTSSARAGVQYIPIFSELVESFVRRIDQPSQLHPREEVHILEFFSKFQ